ncbi:MAG: mannosyltransferase [Nostoc sp.]|uniref:mannosyltransferase n=1 Tax=Nostoc sp. TaxID=1180 RepID=UPI002FEFCBDE
MNSKVNLNTLLLSTLILLALLVRVSAALSFPNIFWPDEIFQTQEPAHRLAFGNGMVTWEFRDGTRSWVFPGILAVVMRLTAWMGDGSSGYLAGVSIFLCLLSLTTILVAFLWGYETGGLVTAVITAGVCSVWFELVYFAPKAFTEVVSAHLLLPGVYLGVHGKNFQPRTRLFLAGCLCGLALALRIQLLPAVIFAVIYICCQQWRKKGMPMIAGILGPILIFGMVDAFTWSYPFQSFWLNIWFNVVEGRSLIYGVSPWYEYLLYLLKSWSFILIPITLLAIIGSRHSPILAWLAIIIVLTHSILAHKEYRFIYAALPMVMILAGLGTAELVVNWLQARRMIIPGLLSLVLWTYSSAVLSSRFDVYKEFSFSTLWITNPETTHWYSGSSNLIALQKLSQEKTICGVGLWGISWALSGGYTYLHHHVPIFLLGEEKDFDQLKAGFNYLVANVPVPQQHEDYTLQKCWKSTCIYKKQGSCTDQHYDVNQILKQQGY